MNYLNETSLIKVVTEEQNEKIGRFSIEPLLPGFGHTIGNSLRRILLSSLYGSAIVSVRINDATHEFSTVAGVREDLIEIILNLKTIRIKNDNQEPISIILDFKGPGKVTAADFKTPAGVEIISKDVYIAEVLKGGKISIEANVERGKGYLPTEKQNKNNLAVGMVAIDAIFTPVKKINYHVTNTRVGQSTDFDKIIFDVETDGTINAVDAFNNATQILIEQFNAINEQLPIKSTTPAKKSKPNKATI